MWNVEGSKAGFTRAVKRDLRRYSLGRLSVKRLIARLNYQFIEDPLAS